MMMEKRNEWLAWAATAVGSLSLLGTTWAQDAPRDGTASADGLLAQQVMHDQREEQKGAEPPLEVLARMPISDDGWSAELPNLRQVVIARRAGPVPVSVAVFNERGEVVQHIDWSEDARALKPVSLDALLAGRYAVRVTDGRRTDVVRFRKD